VVVSPHLDDGVFSLGAAISRAVRTGHDVDVVTVFAGDPGSATPAGEWDRGSGFRSAGEAATARRAEDAAACRALGARPVWLPFAEEQYGEAADDDAVWAALCPHLAAADAVLVPGFPLRHADHLRLARLVVSRTGDGARIGLYAEQPYATWQHEPANAGELGPLLDGAPAWRPLRADGRDRRRKWRACLAYRSQVGRLLRRSPLLPWRVRRYERRAGGEAVAWVSTRNHQR
jgi:LmbE family N-acetylglucosaminyl deacetylase